MPLLRIISSLAERVVIAARSSTKTGWPRRMARSKTEPA